MKTEKYTILTRLIFFLIPLIISCSNDTQPENSTMSGFNYPIDSLEIPKVFIYQRIDSTDILSYSLHQLIVKENQKILIKSTLGYQNTRDSSISELINNIPVLKETYMISKEFKTHNIITLKGEILKNIDNGTDRKTKIKYKEESFITTISTHKIKADTAIIYRFKGENHTCMKTYDKQTISIRFRKFPIINRKREQNGEFIFAKDLGLVFYSITDKKSNSTIKYQLKEIINYSDYIKN